MLFAQIVRACGRGCACDHCAEVAESLADRDARQRSWQIGDEGRHHVHGIGLGSGLPLIYRVRRTPHQYTFVLVKDASVERNRGRCEAMTCVRWLT